MTEAVRPVVLATGGTGGHVFPAEALAGELEARGVPFTLVTDSRGRQWQGALSRRPIHYIRSASPTGSPMQKALALLSLALGLFDAWRALGRIGPSVVVGFGGYASVPTMVAARLRRLPAMLHEQNAVLGRANRLVLGGGAHARGAGGALQLLRCNLLGGPPNRRGAGRVGGLWRCQRNARRVPRGSRVEPGGAWSVGKVHAVGARHARAACGARALAGACGGGRKAGRAR
jgi:UDP-N-acetylglucosamine--N-acetylmuramyl-(pentapeptide) pyrophosphoryl-undecaprenol N-acetylglucosamine transferase